MKHSRGSTGTFRHVIKQASICLLLGAIVNVAVAWGYAWFTPSDSTGTKFVSLDNDDLDGVVRNIWEKYYPPDLNLESSLPLSSLTFYNGGLRYDLVFDIGSMHNPDINFIFVRTGFPMKSLSYHYWVQSRGTNLIGHSDTRFALFWKQPEQPDSIGDRVVALPLRPLWPAFAINTIFYGVIFWILLFCPFIVRRWRRTRRGLCLKCGYDLRGDFEAGCSECGWNRKDSE